jgi:hypothetical protein
MAPVLEQQQRQEIEHYTAEANKLPYFSHFEQRIKDAITADREYLDLYNNMSPAERFAEVRTFYNHFWVEDTIAAQTAQQQPAVPGGTTAAAAVAGQPPSPATTPPAPPVVEGRGGVAPAGAENQLGERVLQAVRKYQQSGDLFSPNAPPS